jgi:hypothetical protein
VTKERDRHAGDLDCEPAAFAITGALDVAAQIREICARLRSEPADP